MSASREKKQRQGTERTNKVDQAQAAYKKKARTYSVIAIVVAVAVVALLVYGSGIFEKGKTAATVGGEKLTVGELGYYYYGARYMYARYGLIDTSKADADQVYNAEENKSYRDFLLETALSTAQRTLAVYDKAIAAGYKDADVKDDLDAQVSTMKSSAANNGYSYKSYLIGIYGEYMTPAVYEKLVTRELVANAYYGDLYNEKKDALTEEDLQKYYEENADSVDTFEYSYLYFKADTVSSSNDDGSERTEEEIAKLKEEAMAAVKEKAELALAQYNNGTEIADIIEAREPSTSADHTSVVGKDSISSIYREDLLKLDDGEAAVVEYEGYGYYMVVFHGRHLDESSTADIRQIYVAAEMEDDADEPTEEAWAAAKAKAEEILASYESGEKTAESFGTLATDNGMSNAGLSTAVTRANLADDARGEWVFADGRVEGDTTVVKFESDKYHGYYVLYFQGENDPTWKNTVRSTLTSDAMTEWMDSFLEEYPTELGSGAELLGH